MDQAQWALPPHVFRLDPWVKGLFLVLEAASGEDWPASPPWAAHQGGVRTKSRGSLARCQVRIGRHGLPARGPASEHWTSDFRPATSLCLRLPFDYCTDPKPPECGCHRRATSKQGSWKSKNHEKRQV